jgi:tRNA threonylcarbamoyl adenosine modification protein YeaZ
MNILAIDTTSSQSSIAVLRDEEIVLEYNFSTGENLAGLLIPSMDFLLKSLKLRLDALDVFGVGVGPGLFTSIRIGLATMKGLLFGRRKPVVPVVTLQALAHKICEGKEAITALIDAGRKEVYAACYSWRNEECTTLIEPMLVAIGSLPQHVPPAKDMRFVGSGAETYRDFIKKHYPEAKLDFRSYFLASEIGRIAYAQFRQKRYLYDLQKLMPFYLRRPDAEMNVPTDREADAADS